MLKRMGKWHEIEPLYQAQRLLDRGLGRVLFQKREPGYSRYRL
jgi:hypothetical protein